MPSNQLTQFSTHLWISDFVTIEKQIISELQVVLCDQNGCKNCKICNLVQQKIHPWIVWLSPENLYSLEQIDEVIDSVQFLLDTKEKRFFIFTQAHELTSACCNRLLKTIEEPHVGYYFVFITNRPQELLPTLISRCFVQNFKAQEVDHFFNEIMKPFIDIKLSQPILFMKMIEKQSIKESSTREIIDLLFKHFYEKLKESIQENNQKNQKKYLNIIFILKKSLLQLPIQGSYKLFWKNFYMEFHQQIS